METISCSLITAKKPPVLSKSLRLDAGELVKSPRGQLAEGEASRLELSLNDFTELLKTAKPNQALVYGVSEYPRALIVPQAELNGRRTDPPTIARDRAHFTWPHGAGVFMCDYDPLPGQALTRDELLQVLYEAWPELEQAPHVWTTSASSCIYSDDGGELRGIEGQRVYVPVMQATDIPRLGQTLYDRLWMAGHGRFIVSGSGALLDRCLIDASVWQPERLDFAGGAQCGPGLKQLRPAPKVFNAEAPFIDSRTLPDLPPDQAKELERIKQAARDAMQGEIAEKRTAWIKEQTEVLTFGSDIGIDSLPIKERTKQYILHGAPKGARSEPIMTVVNALVWANLTDSQIIQIFESYPIGQKYREKGQARFKWLQGHISKARVKVQDRAKPKAFNLTDLGNAERFAAKHKDKVRFCHTWDKWLVWDGMRWKIDAGAKATQLAKETVRSIYKDATDQLDENMRKAVARWAASSEGRSRIDSMLALAKSELGIPVEPHELDADPWLFNCLNGTIDLRTGELRKHNPNDLITKLAPVNADPDATAPLWIQFQNRITNGNENLIRFKQRMYGSALTGDAPDQCLFLLYGTGANGKSTEIETIKYVLGDYARQAEFSTFLVRKNDSVRNDIADLRGARFVSAIEAESGQRLAESIVKQMTGGDTLKARFLFQEYFEFRPTFKIFLAANHKPIIRGTDHAIWRRIRLIPFTVTIPEQERDVKLAHKFKSELSGILNWLLVGCAEWQENGLGTPDEVKEATNAYQDEMDTMSDFLAECCLIDPRCRIKKQDLYEYYQKWCEQNGEEAQKKKAFGSRLIDKGLREDRMNYARFWLGIRLIERSHLEAVK